MGQFGPCSVQNHQTWFSLSIPISSQFYLMCSHMYVSMLWCSMFMDWFKFLLYVLWSEQKTHQTKLNVCMYIWEAHSTCVCVCVRVHVGMCLVASMFSTSHRFLLDGMVMQILTPLSSVPWFPRSIQELDQFADHILCFGSDLASYLPVSCYLCVWQLTVQHRSE